VTLEEGAGIVEVGEVPDLERDLAVREARDRGRDGYLALAGCQVEPVRTADVEMFGQ
jgi:hypothetical protein